MVVFLCLTLMPSTILATTTYDNALANSDYAAYQSSRYAGESWNQLVKTGIEAFHSDNYDVAQNALYKAFNLGCESPIVLFMLALIAEYNKANYSALEYYHMAEQGFKKDNQDHRFAQQFEENYGRALLSSGRREEALALLRSAGAKSQSFWLLKLLGMIAYEEGDTLNAVSYFERAARIQSPEVTKGELASIYTLLGRLFLYKGEKDGAYRYYQKALELDPTNHEAKDYLIKIERSYQQNKALEVLDNLGEM